MRSAVLLLVGLWACDAPPGPEGAASSAPPAPSPSASVSAAPSAKPTEMEGLKVLSPGRQPSLARYTFGAAQTVAVELRWDDALPAQEPLIKHAKERETVRLTCRPQGPGATCTVEVEAAGLEDDDMPAAFRVPINEELATAVGAKATLTVSELGEVKGVEHQPLADPTGQAVSARIVDRLARAVVPLPAVPIGVGGRWTRTHPVKVRGIPVDQTTTYTLMARKGDRLTVTAVAQLKGGEAATPAGSKVAIGGYEAKTTATMTVDLDHVVPVAFTDERRASFWTDKPGRGKQPWTRLTRTAFRQP